MTTTTAFDQLAFPSQMLVWAVRKRLHALVSGTDDSEVAEAFRVAKWEDVHAALMTFVDVLCVTGTHIELHAVACKHLALHETSLLNALARLQAGDDDDARDHLSTLFCGPAVRLALPTVHSIATHLSRRGLNVAPVEAPELEHFAGISPASAAVPAITIH